MCVVSRSAVSHLCVWGLVLLTRLFLFCVCVGSLDSIPLVGWRWLGLPVVCVAVHNSCGFQSLGWVGGGWDTLGRRVPRQAPCVNPSGGWGVVGGDFDGGQSVPAGEADAETVLAEVRKGLCGDDLFVDEVPDGFGFGGNAGGHLDAHDVEVGGKVGHAGGEPFFSGGGGAGGFVSRRRSGLIQVS